MGPMVKLFLLATLAVAYAQQDYDNAPPEPYQFKYDVQDEEGNTQMHEQSSDGKTVRGSYGYTDKDGLFRIVEYIADENGFRAMIKTNEPGTKTGGSADAPVESSAPDQ
ncbi:cuticle protein 16.8 [Rhipicephalus microplus]|uniref:cuticle protein 16.8 n=1 Tax=Rhipicephalus microplus TaxID=6941 RepID=UPI0018897C3A|nr:cuticle protein 16.8-like [Rhipicephalus microplus]